MRKNCIHGPGKGDWKEVLYFKNTIIFISESDDEVKADALRGPSLVQVPFKFACSVFLLLSKEDPEIDRTEQCRV